MPKKNTKPKQTLPKGRELILRDKVGQEYARVERLLGNRRVLCLCLDGFERVCYIRGNMKNKKEFTCVKLGDIVVIAIRDFQATSKADIILKYTSQEVKQLVKLGEIPASILHTEAENESLKDDTLIMDALLNEGEDDEEDEKGGEEHWVDKQLNWLDKNIDYI
jgi:initiation factor 1A